MGCSASKASKVVVPMPEEVKENLKSPSEKSTEISTKTEEKAKGNIIQVKETEDSLKGSQSSLNSASDSSRSNRESSAKSTRTTDSGLGEIEDDLDIITERSTIQQQKRASVDERPPTPELSIEGTTLSRRKSFKEKRVSFSDKQEEVRNRINALSPLGGVTERPQSRGGTAFDIMLCPETGNVKRRPQHLRKLERKKKKGSKLTREELDEKLRKAHDRRMQHEQQLIGKAQALISREKQVKAPLDDFAQRQMVNTEAASS